MTEPVIALRYVGKDWRTDWLPGVPARDLTAAEARQWPEAAQGRLYRAVKKAPTATRKPATKKTSTEPVSEPAPAETEPLEGLTAAEE